MTETLRKVFVPDPDPQPDPQYYMGPGWKELAKCGIRLPATYVPQMGQIGGELGGPQ